MGSAQSYSRAKTLIDSKNLSDCITLVGPAFGDEKERLLTEASALILPSFSEGLPMSVLEAWAYALPVIMTPHCNIPEGFHSDAALRCEPTPESIADALTSLFTASATRCREMGINGRRLVERQFSWQHIADETIRLYNSLLSK